MQSVEFDQKMADCNEINEADVQKKIVIKPQQIERPPDTSAASPAMPHNCQKKRGRKPKKAFKPPVTPSPPVFTIP